MALSSSTTQPSPGNALRLASDGLIDIAHVPASKIAENNANQRCGFLQLPSEIRQMILKYAFSDMHIRVEVAPAPKSYRVSAHQCGLLKQYCALTPGARLPSGNDKPLNLINGTCRQIYSDTVLLHFQTNVFSFQSYAVLRHWVDCMHPVQLQALRNLCLPRDFMHHHSWTRLLSGVRVVYYMDEKRRGVKKLSGREFRDLDSEEYPFWFPELHGPNYSGGRCEGLFYIKDMGFGEVESCMPIIRKLNPKYLNYT